MNTKWQSMILTVVFFVLLAGGNGLCKVAAQGQNESDEVLKQSSWWAAAQKNIQEQEYYVTRQKNTGLPGMDEAWQAPNRAQNLRAYFTSKGITVVRRTDSEPVWQTKLILHGIGRDGNLLPLPEDNSPKTKESRIEFRRGNVTEWYENRSEGLEQGFTIFERQEGKGLLTLELCVEGNARPVLSDDRTYVDFLTDSNVRVLRYGNLAVTDSEGKTVSGHFEISESSLKIVLDDSNSIYPIIIDPLMTSPAWTAESDQASANLGISVGTAGDVNGDGYSDVIVGAEQYDNGQDSEGRAFVYMGSSAGLGMTAAWTAESDQDYANFGCSVGTAGDVNGDGYSDVIVGADGYDNGQNREGMAFVYLGSSAGLSMTADWTAESDRNYARFAYSAGTAGDVNGDGYSDVIVGAPYYDNGQDEEGRTFVYLVPDRKLSIIGSKNDISLITVPNFQLTTKKFLLTYSTIFFLEYISKMIRSERSNPLAFLPSLFLLPTF